MKKKEVGNLYFRKNGNDRLLKENINEDDARICIKEFLHERDYKSYYTRIWKHTYEHGFEQIYDVGSWSEFFVWKVGECDN